MAIKKLIAFVCAVLAGFSLVACATKNDSNPDDTNHDGDEVMLTFDTGDGAFVSGDNRITVVADGSAAALGGKGNPRRSGYAFVGWYNGNIEYDPDGAYTEAVTFTARYDSGEGDEVYNALFDENSTVEISIDMSDAEWKKLNRDYVNFAGGKSPIYRMADWVNVCIETDDGTVRDYWYDEVGVRMKGNTSRRQFYGDDGFFANVHYKLSFKQTFDDDAEYDADERKVWSDDTARKSRKKRKFGGMESFDVKYNKNEDDTYCRDIYAMKAFRDNGIIAPNASLCVVKARNKDKDFINLGVYSLYESVDEVMIARHLPNDAGGDLYKCSWGSGFGADLTRVDGIGVEDELKGLFYTYDKKTNKKNGHAALNNLINTLNSGVTSDFSSVLDVDYFARFEAVNYILGNPDCIRNNKNNYYIYFRSDGRAVIIPYDYDRCLGITKDWNPDGSACTKLAPYTRTTSTGNSQANPLYVKLIDKGAPHDAGSALMKYRKNLTELKEGEQFKISTFNAFKSKYAARYAAMVKGALSTNSLPFGNTRGGNMSYEDYITAKLDTLSKNIDNYLA